MQHGGIQSSPCLCSQARLAPKSLWSLAFRLFFIFSAWHTHTVDTQIATAKMNVCQNLTQCYYREYPHSPQLQWWSRSSLSFKDSRHILTPHFAHFPMHQSLVYNVSDLPWPHPYFKSVWSGSIETTRIAQLIMWERTCGLGSPITCSSEYW